MKNFVHIKLKIKMIECKLSSMCFFSLFTLNAPNQTFEREQTKTKKTQLPVTLLLLCFKTISIQKMLHTKSDLSYPDERISNSDWFIKQYVGRAGVLVKLTLFNLPAEFVDNRLRMNMSGKESGGTLVLLIT